MIFDKDYDASLWYILRADRRNRKEIAEFIKGIPEKLLDNIRASIKNLDKKEFCFDGETSDFYSCASANDPSIYYYFQIDEDNALTITKALYDGNIEEELFQLMLFPVSPDCAKNLENFEEEWLGTVTNNIKTEHISNDIGLMECNESEYNIYNTPLGHFVSYSRELFNGNSEIAIFKPVNLRKVPKDINKENLLSKRLNK